MNEKFQQHVTDSLARLETKMDTLVSPKGRVSTLETKVFYLVIAVVILGVVVLGPQAVAAFIK